MSVWLFTCQDSARRPHGSRPANGRRASRPSITSRRCRVFAQWPAKPKPLGVMPSPRKWTPQRHGAVARTHLTASGEKGKVGGGVPAQIPAPIATLTSAPVWKRRNHAFRSTWDNATTFKEQNIIACRCPDISLPSDITCSRLSEAIAILHLSPGPPPVLLSITCCRSELVFPAAWGWRMLFWTSAVRRDTRKQVSSDCALCDRLVV